MKTGMCKINESPCQLRLEARCFIYFVLQGEWNGVYGLDWLTVILQSFPKKQKTNKKNNNNNKLPVLQFEEIHSEDVCMLMRWSEGGLSIEILAAQASAVPNLIQELPQPPSSFNNPKHQTPLQTKQHQQLT